jgi:hypothetical protein
MISPVITGISGHPISGHSEEHETTAWSQASGLESDDFRVVDTAVLPNRFVPQLQIGPVAQDSRSIKELARAQVFSIRIEQIEAVLALTIGCIGLILTILNR